MQSKNRKSFEEKVKDYISKFHVADVILPRPQMVVCKTDDPVENILKIFLTSKYSRLPVYDEESNRVVGYIYFKDFFWKYLETKGDFEVKHVTRNILTVHENENLLEVFRKMNSSFIPIAVVIDEYSNHIGMVTMEDIIEKVFPEIVDETDEKSDIQEDFEKVEEGKYIVSAWAPVKEVFEKIGIELPEDVDVRTVGGFMMFLSGVIPNYGSVYEYNDWIFKVIELENNRVSKILVKRKGK